MGETDPHIMGVLDVVPMTWRRWDLLLVLDCYGDLNIDVLKHGTLFNQLMVDCFGWPVGPFAMMKGAQTGWKE